MGNVDYIGRIHGLITEFHTMDSRHAATLAEHAAGTDLSQSARYDEQRTTIAFEARDHLRKLADALIELAGPPVPGEPFTLTWAGRGRHEGCEPYCFVVCGSDLDDARRTLARLPLWRQWYEEQRPSDDQAPDVLFLADESHPGIPEWGTYNDLRREQAAASAGAPAAAPPSLTA
jgi:hypothetical protein